MRRVPCIDKLHSLTGFRPQTSLAEIIDRVSAYYRQKEGPWRVPTPSALLIQLRI